MNVNVAWTLTGVKLAEWKQQQRSGSDKPGAFTRWRKKTLYIHVCANCITGSHVKSMPHGGESFFMAASFYQSVGGIYAAGMELQGRC